MRKCFQDYFMLFQTHAWPFGPKWHAAPYPPTPPPSSPPESGTSKGMRFKLLIQSRPPLLPLNQQQSFLPFFLSSFVSAPTLPGSLGSWRCVWTPLLLFDTPRCLCNCDVQAKQCAEQRNLCTPETTSVGICRLVGKTAKQNCFCIFCTGFFVSPVCMWLT